MSSDRRGNGEREAVGVFTTEESLQKAVDDLLVSGFSQTDLSLLASEEAVREKLGHSFHPRSELKDEPEAPRTSYVAPETFGNAKGGLIGALMYIGAGILMAPVAAAGGGLGLIVTAAVIGGGVGGGIGGVLAGILGTQQADEVAEHLAHGGLLLWVRTWTPEEEQRAIEILSRHGGKDVQLHNISSNEPETTAQPR